MFEMCQNMERNRIKAWKVFSENTFESREPKWRHHIHPKDTRNNLLDQVIYYDGTQHEDIMNNVMLCHIFYCNGEWLYAECRFSDCQYAECL